MTHLHLYFQGFRVYTSIFFNIYSPNRLFSLIRKALSAFIILGLFFCFTLSFAFAQNERLDNTRSLSLYFSTLDYSSNIGNDLGELEAEILTLGGGYHPQGSKSFGFYATLARYDESDITVTDARVRAALSAVGFNFDGTLFTAGVTVPIITFGGSEDFNWRAFGGLSYVQEEASYML